MEPAVIGNAKCGRSGGRVDFEACHRSSRSLPGFPPTARGRRSRWLTGTGALSVDSVPSMIVVITYLLSWQCIVGGVSGMQRKHLPADERRSQTVEAVVALAGRQNPSEITTEAIAKHMKLTQGALFRHFATKDAIFEAVMEWVAARLLDRIDRAAAGARSPLDALQAMFMGHVEFVIEHPGVPRMLFGELQRGEATPAKKVARVLLGRYAERLAQRLDAAKAAGEVTADTDTQAAALLFIGSIQGLVMQALLSGNIGLIRNSAPGVFEIYRRGVARQPRPGQVRRERA